MADTATTLITDTLLDMGVIAAQAQPTAAQVQQALRKLNNMIETWNIEGLMVYGATENLLSLVSNQGTYTIGPSGDLNIPYPTNITSAFIRDTSLPPNNIVDYPLYMYTNQEWAYNPIKFQAAQWPNWGIWFNMTFPLVTATLTPTPTTSQYKMVVWTDNIINSMSENTVIILAPGFKRAIVSNLYIELAPSYQIDVPQGIQAIANDSKARIKTNNLQINEITPRFGREYWYDITTNRYIN